LWARLVTSPFTHAIVKSIDITAAEAAGYVVLTHRDIPSAFPITGPRRDKLFVPVGARARYAGQIIAAVLGRSEQDAEDGTRLVKVEYDQLPILLNVEESMKPDALQLYETGNQTLGGYAVETGPVPPTITIKQGDVEKGLAEAEVIVEDRYETAIYQHSTMEPRAAVAEWSFGKLTVWSSNQWAHSAQTALANLFNIPLQNVRVLVGDGGDPNAPGNFMGGGFGDKSGLKEEMVIAALGARKAGVPVKVVYTRKDNFLSATHRFPIVAYIKLGAKRDGTLTAIQADLIVDAGADGGAAGSDTASDLIHPMVIPNIHITVRNFYTNRYHAPGAMRDVGETQGHFFINRILDRMAQKLNMDPFDFMLKNLRDKTKAVDPITGTPYTGIGQPEALLQAAERFRWKERWKGWGNPSWISKDGRKIRAVGMGIMNSAKGAIRNPMTAQLKIDPDGTITFYTGATDIGGGQKTALAIIAAETLGLSSLDNITIISSDTDNTTDTGVSAGSTQTRSGGMGALKAAEDARRQLFDVVAKQLGVDRTQLVAKNDRIYPQDDPSKGLTFKQAAGTLQTSIIGRGTFTAPRQYTRKDGTIVNGYFSRTTAASFAEVEVDLDTYEVQVTDYVAAHDVGRAIFTQGLLEQLRGGLTSQGIGQLLFEEQLADPSTGRYINPNFHDYRLPTILETPPNIEGIWIEYDDPLGPYGAKGIGEPSLTSPACSIPNAVAHAFNVNVTTIPIGREQIIKAVKAQGGG
jgi:CO/xanthine dehydrogenase Mo-binding subunit